VKDTGLNDTVGDAIRVSERGDALFTICALASRAARSFVLHPVLRLTRLGTVEN
jgi:hypothetical protein